MRGSFEWIKKIDEQPTSGIGDSRHIFFEGKNVLDIYPEIA
jgi:hypothetical protein